MSMSTEQAQYVLLLCAYQWYTPPCIPKVDVGEKKGIYHQNLS